MHCINMPVHLIFITEYMPTSVQAVVMEYLLKKESSLL